MSKPAGIVLAGGDSRRMGSDKAMLEVGGMSLLCRATTMLRPLVEEMIVVGSPRRSSLPLPILYAEDLTPGLGPMGGIQTGLQVTPCDRNIFLPVDMPFLRREQLELLLSADAGAEAAVFRICGVLQPLPARLDKGCTPVVDRMIEGGELALVRLFERLSTAIIDLDDQNAALDIDTPEDLSRARRLVEGDRHER